MQSISIRCKINAKRRQKINNKKDSRLTTRCFLVVLPFFIEIKENECGIKSILYFIIFQDPELQENPPKKPIFEKIQRSIMASNPRVTKFKINWDNNIISATPTTSGNGVGVGIDNGTSSSMQPAFAT